MQKVMERLDRQDEMLLSLKAQGEAPNPMEGIRMFDNQDLCMLLQISKRTLQRYRSVGALPYAGQEDLLQRDGRSDIPHRTCQGLQEGRYRVLQGSYP